MQWLIGCSPSAWCPHTTHPSSSSYCALWNKMISLLPTACGSQDHGGNAELMRCQPNACASHIEISQVLCPFSSQREELVGFFFRLWQCRESNGPHYSFQLRFLQGGMSMGLRKVCKGQSTPTDVTFQHFPACPICLQLPVSLCLNHLFCKAFVPQCVPGSAILLGPDEARLILLPQQWLLNLIILALMNWH